MSLYFNYKLQMYSFVKNKNTKHIIYAILKKKNIMPCFSLKSQE